MFSFFRRRTPHATLYHDHFVDPESGLDTITPLENGTLDEMIDAAMKLDPRQFSPASSGPVATSCGRPISAKWPTAGRRT